MKGTIIGRDAATGEGVITDQTGTRYKFAAGEWKSPGEAMPGRQVDFALDGDRAVDVYATPGSTPFNVGQMEPERQAMTFGIVSLVCAVMTFLLGPIGIITAVIAVIFGIKGKNAGANLADKTGYYLSIGGLAIAGIALLVTLLALTACASILGGIAAFS